MTTTTTTPTTEGAAPPAGAINTWAIHLFACPFCGVQPGENCVEAQGRREREQAHNRRIKPVQTVFRLGINEGKRRTWQEVVNFAASKNALVRLPKQ